jgi:putative membrane protein
MEKNKLTLSQIILLAIQGAIVGLGAILPGVSGGVLLVAFGLYQPLMELLTTPKVAFRKNWRIFAPFLTGWAIGFVLLARVCEIFFSLAPDVAIFLFFGLVCGVIPELFKKSEQESRDASWTPFVISLSISYILFHLIEAGEAVSVPVNFFSFAFCGLLWGLSLIVPGLSSSTLLIYLGLYVPLTDGIASFDLSVLLPFGIGIVATVLLLALDKRKASIIVSCIAGVLIILYCTLVYSGYDSALNTSDLKIMQIIVSYVIPAVAVPFANIIMVNKRL